MRFVLLWSSYLSNDHQIMATKLRGKGSDSIPCSCFIGVKGVCLSITQKLELKTELRTIRKIHYLFSPKIQH